MYFNTAMMPYRQGTSDIAPALSEARSGYFVTREARADGLRSFYLIGRNHVR